MSDAMSSTIRTAKETVWHVEPVGARFLVTKGGVSVSVWFNRYEDALEDAASRNIMEGLVLDPRTQQELIEMAELLMSVRRRSRAMADRYRKHPAFQPDNDTEDIFGKLARIIESMVE